MKRFLLAVLLALAAAPAAAQTPTYEYRLVNDLQVSATVYEFDIYLKRTGATALEVANTQAGILFNPAIRNGGTLTFGIVAGTSEFDASQVPSSFSVDNTNNILRIAPRSNPGAGNGTIAGTSGNGIRLGRFRVTNSVAFASTTPNLAWNFVGTGGFWASRLSAYVAATATDITVPSSHLLETVNPTLNAPISGTIFEDRNGDGVRDPDEGGLAGWRIRLSVGGSPADSTLTDASGNYGFPSLANGSYVVTQVLQSGWVRTTAAASYPVTVTSGSFSTNNNFGDFRLGSIDGTIYDDQDGNGAKGGGEPGLSGWRVRLLRSGIPVDSMLSGAGGTYSFGSLVAGSYTLSEAVPAGWSQTAPAFPGTHAVSITSGLSVSGKDFGNFDLGSVTGRVFHDLDGDGVKDAGEPGLPGWRIALAGPVTDTATTDANGDYAFNALPAGSYTLGEVPQGGWVRSAPGGAGTHAVVIVSGSSSTGKDFGDYQEASIAGMVYNDLNGNGAKEGGEGGLSNWRVRLSVGGTPVDSALTNAGGAYAFVGLAPGTYTVSVALKPGWTGTAPPGGSFSVPLSSGGAATARDFGSFQLGSIAGATYEDANGNGARDPGETGLAGWMVRLYKGATRVDSLLTDLSGNYQFTSVGSGAYTVAAALPSGWQLTSPAAPGTHAVAMTSGAAVTGKDFGAYQLGSIAGMKFNDIDGDGVKDPGEPGLPGWIIRLFLGATPVDSAVTDGGGLFQFTGLLAGSYTLTEASQSGWTRTLPLAGSYGVAVTSGAAATGKDFGGFQLGTIAGAVYDDLNGSSAKDVGEPSLASWRIRLAKNGVPVDSVLSDGSGQYAFSGLGVGTYTVSEALQAGWLTTNPAGGTHTVGVTSGTSAPGRDFGNFRLCTVTGTVYHDVNGNGVKDTTEPGLAAWRVRLARNGVPYDSVLTDAGGAYAFNGLTVATYTVSHQVQPSWFQSAPGAPGTVTIAVTTGGTTFAAIRFGDYQRGSIAGTLFNDVNGNAVRDGGEPALAGWRVRLAGVKTDSALTDTGGGYLFSALAPGNYGVAQDVQSGWTQTLPHSQGQYLVALASGAVEVDRSFGNFQSTAIAGVVFNDLNGNGAKDVGEPGLANWRIRLGRNGGQVDSVLTDTAGAYLFRDLVAGTYTVAEAVQAGWNQSLPATPGTYTIVITSGSSASARDFGNFQRGALRGLAFLDHNGNGTQDSAETPMSGIRVRLSGAKTDSVLTDGAGAFAFTGLVPGAYVLSEQVSAGWMLTAPASPGTHAVALASGADIGGRNFANFQLGAISGVVFDDRAGDGVKDSVDGPIAGRRVRLLQGIVPKDSVLTDAAGAYAFPGLGPGNYIVHEVVPAGWVETAPAAPGTYAVAMTSGAALSGRSFGEFQLGLIRGVAFDDANGNAVRDSAEHGVAGWRVRLAGPRADSVFTDSLGRFAFTALRAGAYVVSVDVLPGWAQTLPPPPGSYALGVTSGFQRTDADLGVTMLSVLYARVSARWNLLSVPLDPSGGDMRKSVLFPGAVSPAFAFADQYVVRDTLLPGEGYWMKFDSAQTIGMTGLGRLRDTIAVSAGWNLVGALKGSILAASVASVPAGIVASPYFGYANGYREADTLQQFRAYWVKATAPGELLLAAPGASGPLAAKTVAAGRRGISGAAPGAARDVIEIADGNGNLQALTLVARDGDDPVPSSEMPPLPPAGVFDARFGSERAEESYPVRLDGAATFAVRVQAEASPVTIRWKPADGTARACRLAREGAATSPRVLAPGASTAFSGGAVLRFTLTLEPTEIPREYALDQNYPNPFNPSTEIRYSLPVRSQVRLVLYSILGERVATLVDGTEEPGVHRQRWTATVASGVYFYRLEARSVTDPGRTFTQVKKMMLVR